VLHRIDDFGEEESHLRRDRPSWVGLPPAPISARAASVADPLRGIPEGNLPGAWRHAPAGLPPESALTYNFLYVNTIAAKEG
jgi:hypothetical protein